MNEEQRLQILSQISQIQQECRTALFELHQSKEQGRYVEDTQELIELKKQVASLSTKVDVIQLIRNQLHTIQDHNSKVDEFTQKFSTKDELLERIAEVYPKMTNNERTEALYKEMIVSFDEFDHTEKDLLRERQQTLRSTKDRQIETQQERQQRLAHEFE